MKIDYNQFNFCKGCKIKYPKYVIQCTEIGCHKRLASHAKGYATRMEVPRIV